MKLKRILSYFLSFVFVILPFLFSPENLVFAESHTTVSTYEQLKIALEDTNNTLINLNPGRYTLTSPLIIDHKVRLVGMTDLGGKKFNNATILNEAADVILDGQDKYNIVVGVSAMLENLTLTRLRSADISQTDVYDIFIPKFKDRFNVDISKFRDYLIEHGYFIPKETPQAGTIAAEWVDLITRLFLSGTDAAKEANQAQFEYLLNDVMYETYNHGPLRINNGTVQNCRIINNKSTTKAVVMIHGGTFFGNLVAFNTVSDSIKTTRGYIREQSETESASIVNERGLSFILNNTVAYNDCAKITTSTGEQGEVIETETRTDDCDAIGLYNQSFVINNITYNSGRYSIYNEQGLSEMICNNATSLYSGEDSNYFGSAYFENNINLGAAISGGPQTEYKAPFIKNPIAGGETAPNWGYIGSGDNAVWPENGYDFAIAYRETNLTVINKGMDIFFDKIPNDMNGISRIAGGKPSIGAFEPLNEDGSAADLAVPTYPQGDVMYVSSNGSNENDGSSWSNAMASPEQAIINAARGKPRTLMIGKGTYNIIGRVMLYIQKDGFTGGIWGGMVLPEGMKVYGGLMIDQSGTVQEQLNKRDVGQSSWDFGNDATVLKGGGLRKKLFKLASVQVNTDYNPDYLGIRDDVDWTQPGWTNDKTKDTTRITNGVRVLTQVEDFEGSSGTLVDGVDLQNGYVISRREVTPSWPGVKKANQVGGAGALLRTGTAMRNSIVETSYEATLNLPYYNDESNACGGGIMVSGGTVSGSLIRDNISETSGGGIYLSSGRVEDCSIEDNTAFNMGGGIVTAHVKTFRPSSIYHTSIKDNKAIGVVPPQTNRFGIPYASDPNYGLGIGGGAWIGNNATADRIIFDNNRSKNGGDGLYVGTKSSSVAQAIIENSLITNHSEGSNQAVYMESGSLLDSDVIKNKTPIAASSGNSAVITGTVFWQNENDIPSGLNLTYSAAPGGYGEQSAMNVDLSTNNSDAMGPNFVDPDSANYHLLSSSPLVERNSPSDTVDHDYDLVTRPQGGANDIGMFEYTGEVAVTFDANNGAFTDSSATITKTIAWGTRVGDAKPEDPTKDGFAFAGYTKVRDDLSTKVDDDFRITNSMVLYAYYEVPSVQKTGDNNSTVYIILGCVLVMLLSFGTYYFLKKRNKD